MAYMARQKHKPLNETLRESRERLGMSQVDAAGKLSVTPEHLCRVELGSASPGLGLLRRARKLYKIGELMLD